jgi:SAM-dependent methyltransferase
VGLQPSQEQPQQREPSGSFDDFAADYSRLVEGVVAFSGQTHEFFLDAKARQLAEVIRRRFGESASPRVLEVGCGLGLMQRRLSPRLPRLWGIDTALGCLAQAGRAAGGSRLVAADGQRAPFAEGSFDLVFAVCVLHHVPQARRAALVAEMTRLTRRGGLVAIWEHNPWNPLTRRVVARCPLDRDAVLLSLLQARRLLRGAGLARIRSRCLLFFPWRGRAWQEAERLVARVPLGAQFAALGIKP